MRTKRFAKFLAKPNIAAYKDFAKILDDALSKVVKEGMDVAHAKEVLGTLETAYCAGWLDGLATAVAYYRQYLRNELGARVPDTKESRNVDLYEAEKFLTSQVEVPTPDDADSVLRADDARHGAIFVEEDVVEDITRDITRLMDQKQDKP